MPDLYKYEKMTEKDFLRHLFTFSKAYASENLNFICFSFVLIRLGLYPFVETHTLRPIPVHEYITTCELNLDFEQKT